MNILGIQSFVRYAFDAFKQFTKDIRMAFIDPDETFRQSSQIPRRQSNGDRWRSLARYPFSFLEYI